MRVVGLIASAIVGCVSFYRQTALLKIKHGILKVPITHNYHHNRYIEIHHLYIAHFAAKYFIYPFIIPER